MKIWCDFHIHSCLSPCGDLDMSPAAIAVQARRLGLDMIALTDHNCARNTPAFEKACQREGLTGLYGVEVTSLEEAHLLCLFPEVQAARDFGEEIYSRLPPMTNDPELNDYQLVVDLEENILDEAENYLNAGGIDLPADELMQRVHKAGGLFIPAHIDKPVFSLVSQLGFLPPEAYDGVEITRWPAVTDTAGYCPLMNSDAHYIHDIGKRCTVFHAETPGFDALRKALQSRSVSYSGLKDPGN